MRRFYYVLGVVLLAGLGFVIYWLAVRGKPGPPAVAAASQADFSHLPEGSEVFPIDWLRATTSVRTGRPFLDNLDRFGLYADPDGPSVPGDATARLPVGLTLTKPIGSEMEMLGVNCSACHSTTIQFNGHKVRIDGAPNVFDITEFYEDVFLSAEATVTDPAKLTAFLTRLKEQGPRDPPTRLLVALLPHLETAAGVNAAADLAGLLLGHLRSLFRDDTPVSPAEVARLAALFTEPSAEGRQAIEADLAQLRAAQPVWNALKAKFEAAKAAVAELRDLPPEALPMLEARFVFLKKIKRQQALSAGLPKPGPGRVDAFANARLFLFADADARPPSAPVRYPAIWALDNRHWVHWDGNTNSIAERNAGQALGLGALVDTRTMKSTLLPVNLYRLEDYVRKLPAPGWPAEFGPVNPSSAEYGQGKALYAQHCASCHEGREKRETADLPDGKGRKILANGKVLVYLIGTDDTRQANFAAPLADGRNFARELGALQRKIKDRAIADHAEELARPGIKEIRDRMDALDRDPEWLTNRGYIARPLAGAWATAPFLHNGSVPSIADLLKPAKDRPRTFWVGAREYDPQRLGYCYEKDRIPADQQAYLREFDTSLPGNANGGHEFGTALQEDAKRALLVYLKGLSPSDFKQD
jgi:mono/diheme cytochrome c family protein